MVFHFLLPYIFTPLNSGSMCRIFYLLFCFLTFRIHSVYTQSFVDCGIFKREYFNLYGFYWEKGCDRTYGWILEPVMKDECVVKDF